jgi:hypothetical protein
MVVRDDPAARATQAAGADAWWLFAEEILDHVRLPYTAASPAELSELDDSVGVVVLPHPFRLDEPTQQALLEWLRRGGVALLCGGPGALSEAIGVRAGAQIREGHVHVPSGPWLPSPPDVPLHAFGGAELLGGRELAAWSNGAPAIATCHVGEGVAVVFGVDVWQSIVRIQQGWPVTADGAPALDGTSPVDDGVLKCDDGVALSYERDRALPPGEGGAGDDPFPYVHPPQVAAPMFHRPHADLWRPVFLSALFDAAASRGIVLPWLGYWPAGVPAVAHMSQDSHSEDEVNDFAMTGLKVFEDIDVKVTWCHSYPGGIAPAIVAAIEEHGHEQALHYNAMGDADIALWGWPRMRAQHAWAQAITGREHIVSNKNHFTRWEGWHEFFLWCERLGIEIDQSRGPSKQGNAGFIFGTCHLSFPIADAADGNRRIDVLELALQTQDLARHSHASVGDVILDQALAEHGVAHFLFHSKHLHLSQDVRDACARMAEGARRRGMQWWTSEQLNAWERARREVDIQAEAEGGGQIRVDVDSRRALDNAAVLLALPGLVENSRYVVTDGEARLSIVRRHGRLFLELSANLPAGHVSFGVGRAAD